MFWRKERSMRTIKFRGKRVDNGEWISGSLDLTASQASILWDRIDNEGDTAPWFADVDPDTIGQFTGLLDKNGTEIYEGDILRLGNSDSGVCEVGWSGSVSAYCIRFHFEAALGLKPLGSWKECERNIVVIGNIHDNPELLKGGEIK